MVSNQQPYTTKLLRNIHVTKEYHKKTTENHIIDYKMTKKLYKTKIQLLFEIIILMKCNSDKKQLIKRNI